MGLETGTGSFKHKDSKNKDGEVRTNASSLEAGNGKSGTDAPGLFGEGDVPSVGTAYGNLFMAAVDLRSTPGQD